MWNPDEWLRKRLSRSADDRRKHWLGILDVERRQQMLAELRSSLGDFGIRPEQPAGAAELSPVLLSQEKLASGVIRERVEYTTVEGLRVPAYVLIPADRLPSGKRAAVVAWHGHGYGSREIAGLTADGSSNESVPGIHGNYALELARRGFLVIAPEMIGFGDRRLAADRKEAAAMGNASVNSCFTLASVLLLQGRTLAGLRVSEAMRSIDYLLTRSDVDGARIGCFGFSGGGMVASLTAALDERVRATVVCGYASTYERSILARRHCLDNYIPGVLSYAEMPDMLGLVAPRPLFLESGSQDPLFPAAAFLDAVESLSGLYARLEAADRFDWHLFEGNHEVSGARSYEWLRRHLM